MENQKIEVTAVKPKYLLKVSIVLYRNRRDQIINVIQSLRKTEFTYQLELIDNSLEKSFFSWVQLQPHEIYIFTGQNLGFGKAHNISIRKSIEEQIPYHLILNPDVYFDEQKILERIYHYMESHPDVGLLTPKVLYPDGSTQYLCKRLPRPYDLFVRRFGSRQAKEKNNFYFEMRDKDYDKIMEVPSLSGCFMYFRTEVLKKIQGFDERFFMYMEDVDISRRASQVAKNIHFPEVKIYHEHGQGSYKSKKLLWYHIRSVLQYFWKWSSFS
ncbi:MAG: glycosyltransferase family 2 protein [Bdellovibrionaceae bacterium]|nr:glycosyltransferase family 2 protein [Pseudobdellovibrionaceae bacterium]